jgi:uncharacterized protein (TIGR00369 family)
MADQQPATSAFIELLGMHFDHLDGDRVAGFLDVDERHHQPFGIVHGGIWASVVETAASMGAWQAVREQGSAVVGVSNHTDFLRSHTHGRVLFEGKPVHQGRTSQLWDVTITRTSDGKLVARGQLRLQNVEPR